MLNIRGSLKLPTIDNRVVIIYKARVEESEERLDFMLQHFTATIPNRYLIIPTVTSVTGRVSSPSVSYFYQEQIQFLINPFPFPWQFGIIMDN